MLRTSKVRMRDFGTVKRNGRLGHTNDMCIGDRQHSIKRNDKQKRTREVKAPTDVRTKATWGGVKDKRTDIQKVGAKDNPAYLMTMHLDSSTAAERLKRLSVRSATGWHELAPKL